MKEGDKVTTYERLVLANIRMALALYKKRKNIKGFLKHMIMIAEKADKDMFEPAALIAYDESIKEVARESGSKSFDKVDPAAIVKHLSYDGTRAANSSKASAASFSKKPSANKQGTKTASGVCITSTQEVVLRAVLVSKNMFVQHVIAVATLMNLALTWIARLQRNEVFMAAPRLATWQRRGPPLPSTRQLWISTKPVTSQPPPS